MTHYRTHYTTHYTTDYKTHYTTHYMTHYTAHKLYIYIGVGSRDLFIDEAHTALGIFPVFFPCMLPTPFCGIFWDSFN